MDEVRSICIAEIHQCFFYSEIRCKRERDSESIKRDPLEREGNLYDPTFHKVCKNKLCTNEAGMPHARVM
jgi:hypothetical protein